MDPRDQFSAFDVDAPNGSDLDPVREDPKPEAPQEDMVPKSRLDEVRAQRDELHGQREEMIRSMLSGAPTQGLPQETPQEAEDFTKVMIPEGTDPEVAQLMTPILEANNKLVYERLSKNMDTRVAPVEERISYADMVDNVSRRVDGFDHVRGDVVNLLEHMSPAQRAEYNSESGLEALALRALRDRDQRTASRTDMAHSAPFGTSEARPTRREATEKDVWDLSDEEFERALAQKGMSL